MTSFTIGLLDTPGSTLKAVYAFLSGLDPTKAWTITVGPYKADRSKAQNRLAFRWYKEIAEQKMDQTPEEWRAYCKLVKGVPILRSENEAFCEIYDRVIKPLGYEDKLALMSAPIDMPITSLMNVKQFSAFLEEVQRHFATEGVILTSGDDLYEQAMGRKRAPLPEDQGRQGG